MTQRNRFGTEKLWQAFMIAAVLFAVIASVAHPGFAEPQGVSITSSVTENASVRSPASSAAQGGSFTTLVLNVTSQTSKWKAYVGNVTGKMTLDNSLNQTIYDWSLSIVQGEVYVSRNNSVTFTSLACANAANITAEHTALGINATSDDSINNTFRQSVHRSFIVGGTGLVANSSCSAIATYINDAAQTPSESADFQEILMSDGRNVVYVTLLENNAAGFDNSQYDFQAIVPDDPTATTTTYYFYAELG